MSFNDNNNNPNFHPGHGMGPAGASLSDLLTAVKNVAVNIANLGLLYQTIQGQSAAKALTASTLVRQGSGWIARVVVTAETGSAVGQIIDSNNASATAPVIFVIPATVGSYVVNLPYSLGLLVVPGNGMTVTVGYT